MCNHSFVLFISFVFLIFGKFGIYCFFFFFFTKKFMQLVYCKHQQQKNLVCRFLRSWDIIIDYFLCKTMGNETDRKFVAKILYAIYKVGINLLGSALTRRTYFNDHSFLPSTKFISFFFFFPCKFHLATQGFSAAL